MHNLLLIFGKTTKYADQMSHITSTLENIKARWKVLYDMREAQDLSEDVATRLRAQIREIMPQSRGKIVSSGGYVLPLSRGRKLNVANTPILILYDGERPIQVYPHMLGRAYTTALEGLNRILAKSPGTSEEEGLLEPSLQKRARY